MTRVLLIHGLGADASAWDAVRPHLARRLPDAAVEAPTLPDDFDAAVERAADWLSAGPGVVCGHSMGGHVALCAARRVGAGHPLVLLAPGGIGPPPPLPAVRAIYGREVLLARDADAFDRAMRLLYADPDHPWAERRAARNRAMAGTPEQRRWAARVDGHVRGVLARWIGDAADTPGPLFIARGAADPMVPAAPLAALAAAHARARFESWPGVGHMLPDEAPERVAARIADHRPERDR